MSNIFAAKCERQGITPLVCIHFCKMFWGTAKLRHNTILYYIVNSCSSVAQAAVHSPLSVQSSKFWLEFITC